MHTREVCGSGIPKAENKTAACFKYCSLKGSRLEAPIDCEEGMGGSIQSVYKSNNIHKQKLLSKGKITKIYKY